jgi:hypothetical protein
MFPWNSRPYEGFSPIPVGAGFGPRTSSPEGLSHMMMEQQADRGSRFLLFSILNSGKSFLQMFDVPVFMQEAISG